jgi:LysM repeat protein
MARRIHLILVSLVLLATLSIVLIPASPALAQACTQTHVVQPGENLFRIGLRYGQLWTTLAAWNNLANPNVIYVGQVLCVSGPNPAGPYVPPGTGGPRIVRPGNPFGPTTDPRVFFPEITLGQKFQLRGYNFPRNSQVVISLTTLGNPPYVPYYTATTDATGQFFVEVIIPDVLRLASTVAVDVRTANGFYARNWFYNY